MIKRGLTTLLTFALYIGAALAQISQVQGTVMHDRKPLAQANVMEMDSNHRILNQTYTDTNGHFIMNVTGNKTSLRVTAPGMHRFTQKIGHTSNWIVEMKKENVPDVPNKAKNSYETTKLLVGWHNGHIIPQICWVEQLDEFLFTIVIPVHMSSMVDEYPIGRKMTVTDINGHVVATGECIEQALPKEGIPQSWDPFIRLSGAEMNEDGSTFTSNDRVCFAYPRFSFSKTEMEYMIDHYNELVCFAVDTSRGNNFWKYYPSTKFARELQKILNLMQK